MSDKQRLESILAMVVGFLVLGLIFHLPILLKVGAIIGVVSLFSSFLGGKIAWVWIKIAEVLGYINSKILLSVIFFVFLTPVSFLYRLFKKDNLVLKRKPDSYYVTRNHQYKADELENLW